MAQEERFRAPTAAPAAGQAASQAASQAESSAPWTETQHRYLTRPRAKPKFKAALSAAHLFGAAGSITTITTRYNATQLELGMHHEHGGLTQVDRFVARTESGRLAPELVERDVFWGDGEGLSWPQDEDLARRERTRFRPDGIGLPAATYPDMMLPFLMRWQPHDGQTRAVWSWTSDRFLARVYYEVRKRETITVPAGRFATALIWMYPDLNDWIALGGMITKLAKPLLPRYDIWIEAAAPHRVIRFEGPFGPPGAPEVLLELRGD